MKSLDNLLDTSVEVLLSGHKIITGILVDCGTDIIVIYSGDKFFYISLTHIQYIRTVKTSTDDLQPPPETPTGSVNKITYKKILKHALGLFVEIFTIRNPLCGYLTHIQNDYLVFNSPIFKTMYIATHHIKWIVPQDCDCTPYTGPGNISQHLSHELEKDLHTQLNKQAGKIVIFDLGEEVTKAGTLHSINDDLVSLVLTTGEKVNWNLRHLKTVHLP